MARVYNFSAGPAALPLEVLQQAQEELLDWHGLGTSVMEISHRSNDYLQVAQQAEADLRDLLNIPANYKVLFLQGGARSQFAMIPMNLLDKKNTANYLDIGIWSKLAINEAKRYCQVNIVASAENTGYTSIPALTCWKIDNSAAYLHYVDNETINGVEFPDVPPITDIPLVSDMSSNLLSRPVAVDKFAVIYAGAQKNIGPAGLTLVIIRDDFLGKALPFTPSMFDYALHAREGSMYNTPPTFAWYMAGLTFRWLKQKGGLKKMAEINQRKADKLYDFIDHQDFYSNSVEKPFRSRMNVVFTLRNEKLNSLFLEETRKMGLAYLKGHKLVGGMRASIYNALPEEGIDLLISFMADFAKRNG